MTRLLPWEELVESARNHALDAARLVGTPADTVATISWMKESDR